jgi:LPXTG-motif cell wall-anchored protein
MSARAEIRLASAPLAFRRSVRAVCGSVCLALAPLLVIVGLADSAWADSPYRVLLTGDSIVEACGQVGPSGETALAVALRSALRSRGLRAGVTGLVPPHSAVVPTGSTAPRSWRLRYRGGWRFEGLFGGPASRYGADGFSSVTTEPGASAAGEFRGDTVAVLFTRAPDGGRFTLHVGRRHRGLNGRGALDGGGVAWLRAPDRVDGVRVVNDTGTLRLEGLVVRRRGDEVELAFAARSGACGAEGISRTNRQAIEALRPDLTLVMFGTNDEARASAGVVGAREDFVRGLTVRARLARRTGGCVIVPHAPNDRPADLQREFADLARDVALREGCSYASGFRTLWGPEGDSVRRGLTIDGVHPTSAGYQLMSAKLAGIISRQRTCASGAECLQRAAAGESSWAATILAGLGLLAGWFVWRLRKKRRRPT